MRSLIIIAAAVLAFASSAVHAGAWPEIDDLFRLDNGTLLIVTKVKVHGDVDNSSVCLRQKGNPSQSCVWNKIGDLKGNWIIYEGVPQSDLR